MIIGYEFVNVDDIYFDFFLLHANLFNW
jgi:hypothetical protein